MAILGYNRRLGLLIAAATLWALFSIGAALGMVRGDNRPPVELSLGVPPGGVHLRGELTAIAEEDGILNLTIGLPPDAPEDARDQMELPEDITVEYISIDARQPGQRRRPEPELGAGIEARPRELPGGGILLLSSRYAVNIRPGQIRVFPRPKELDGEFLRRLFGGGRGRMQDMPPDQGGQGGPPGPPRDDMGPQQGPGRQQHPPGDGIGQQQLPPRDGQGPPPGRGPQQGQPGGQQRPPDGNPPTGR